MVPLKLAEAGRWQDEREERLHAQICQDKS